jgi:hypothetical protein
VDGEDEEFAHGANRTMTANARKTAPHRRIPSYCEFGTDRITLLFPSQTQYRRTGLLCKDFHGTPGCHAIAGGIQSG